MSAVAYLTIAFFVLFWGIWGLLRPRALFFAKAEWQTRYHAFYFPFTCAVFFLLCSLSESEAGAPWVVTLFVGIFPLLYFLVLCGVGVRKK